MFDFFTVYVERTKYGVEISPDFQVVKSKDLMTRSGDFYAIWDEENNIWSTDEQVAIRLIDRQLDNYAQRYKESGENVKVKYLRRAKTHSIDDFHKLCQRQMRENYHELDETLTFSNSEIKKTDYSSKRLSYPLEKGDTSAWDELMSVLYSPEELEKLEWVIGSIINGDSKKIQKFVVLYGAPKTGKSTFLNIVQKLFDGYWTVFDAKALGSANKDFAMEPFRNNPLVAIQHDGDLSHIEDNTRLNSLVSHETVLMNVKNARQYPMRFNGFLFMGTNKPVKITDSKSGLLRRLIDVTPTGNRVSGSSYEKLMKQISFQYGAIAYKCKRIYEKNKHKYDDYVPINMMGASNDFYSFISDFSMIFKADDSVTLKAAWDMYKTWVDDCKIQYPLNRRVFQEELKSYFKEFRERDRLEDGTNVRSRYVGFKFTSVSGDIKATSFDKAPEWLKLKPQSSILDELWKNRPAQYATEDEKPTCKWANCVTKLSDIDSSKTHYVKPEEKDIVIDFDLKDSDGNKSLEQNLKAAANFPPTYAEVSKSGNGLHLHYVYMGDISLLNPVYSDGIEVKVFNGGSSLRRRLSICNDVDISTISTGLPLKERKSKMVNYKEIETEEDLRRSIGRALRKQRSEFTSQNISFILEDLEKAYNSGLVYDVSDLYDVVMAFAGRSKNHSQECLKMVHKMHFKSKQTEDEATIIQQEDAPIVIFDVEVFINLFVVCWKLLGKDKPVHAMINPRPRDIDILFGYRLVGFNNLKYDNIIIYARHMGYDNEQLYQLSKLLISKDKNIPFIGAENVSFTDIFDYSAKKQSLKKWEIELSRKDPSLRHLENAIPWDDPVPESRWNEIVEYCKNDVVSTEAVWNATQSDFIAREILADMSGLTVNASTNRQTTRFIFGNNRSPQNEFNYRFMGDISQASLDTVPSLECDWDYTMFNKDGRPIYPGYTFDYDEERKCRVSMYRGEEVGEGGYVYAEPGIYYNAKVFDVASMHPSSIIAENLFGDRYTARFKDIYDLRIAIKHKDFDKAKTMLDGIAAKYLKDEDSAKALAYALKIAINSVYGLTSAKFKNPFKDERNIDNIVAKRGALFMINLKHEVQNRGLNVIHIKTDSIKLTIPNSSPEIEQFILDYGTLYGYTFEIEDEYDRICLVNDAVYIAKYKTPKKDKDTGEDIWWTATGAQFAVPYVHKKLFSHKPIEFSDLCVTFSVTSAMYNDLNEDLPDVTSEEALLKNAIKNNDLESIGVLQESIKRGHNYSFVGRVGEFCPILPGHGGGELLREKDGKYSALSGTKGYRWLESEFIRSHHLEDIIDISYFDSLAEKAKAEINKYGDFDKFVADTEV